jgi:hypothetical protein
MQQAQQRLHVYSTSSTSTAMTRPVPERVRSSVRVRATWNTGRKTKLRSIKWLGTPCWLNRARTPANRATAAACSGASGARKLAGVQQQRRGRVAPLSQMQQFAGPGWIGGRGDDDDGAAAAAGGVQIAQQPVQRIARHGFSLGQRLQDAPKLQLAALGRQLAAGRGQADAPVLGQHLRCQRGGQGNGILQGALDPLARVARRIQIQHHPQIAGRLQIELFDHEGEAARLHAAHVGRLAPVDGAQRIARRVGAHRGHGGGGLMGAALGAGQARGQAAQQAQIGQHHGPRIDQYRAHIRIGHHHLEQAQRVAAAQLPRAEAEDAAALAAPLGPIALPVVGPRIGYPVWPVARQIGMVQNLHPQGRQRGAVGHGELFAQHVAHQHPDAARRALAAQPGTERARPQVTEKHQHTQRQQNANPDAGRVENLVDQQQAQDNQRQPAAHANAAPDRSWRGLLAGGTGELIVVHGLSLAQPR